MPVVAFGPIPDWQLCKGDRPEGHVSVGQACPTQSTDEQLDRLAVGIGTGGDDYSQGEVRLELPANRQRVFGLVLVAKLRVSGRQLKPCEPFLMWDVVEGGDCFLVPLQIDQDAAA